MIKSMRNQFDHLLNNIHIKHQVPIHGLLCLFFDSDKKIAVVGSGPSGMSWAYQLVGRGYEVAVFACVGLFVLRRRFESAREATLFLPALCLGATVPLATEICTQNLEAAGGTVGRVYAVNTLGAIVGTLGASFVLIPAFGSRALAQGIGATVAATGLLYLLTDGMDAPAADEPPPVTVGLAPIEGGGLVTVGGAF